MDELVAAGTIAYYEVREGQVSLYWRALAPSQRVRVPLVVVADVPGRLRAV